MYLIDRTINFIRIYFAILLTVLYFSFYNSSVYFLFFTNTILAYIPIELTFLAIFYNKKYSIILIIVIWLIFLPNNFYLMTDLFHLSLLYPYDKTTLLINKDVMNWLKLCLILLSVIPSTLLGCWSIEKMATILSKRLQLERHSLYLILCILFFNTIGIYIGRFIRLNSIDFFINHSESRKRIFNDLDKIDNESIEVLIIIFIFSCGLMLSYSLFKGLLYKEWKESVKKDDSSRSSR